MILLVAAWIVLGGLAFVLGAGLLSRLQGQADAKAGDQFFISMWLGLAGLELVAVCISFVAPVRPVFFAGATLVAGVLLIRRDWRGVLDRARTAVGLQAVTAAALILLASGIITGGLRWTPDAGEYHYPAVRWFAEFGEVRGFGNVLIRFGFTSGTWALLAPFDVALPRHAAAVLNGFVFCLLNGHIALFLHRCRSGTSEVADWFLAACSAGLVVIGVAVGFFTTNAPDPLVAALTIVAAWQIVEGGRRTATLGSMVPLVLAGGAMNAKLSALMLVPVAALFAVRGGNIRRWIVVSVVGWAVVAPYFVASFMATGCLAMPAIQSCFSVPWAVPLWRVAEIADQLWVWARWQSPLPADATQFGWLSRWFFASNGFWFHAAVFWPAAACFAAWLAMTRLRITRGEAWAVALIAPSLVVLFATAPDVRYNLGLFLVPAGLLAMRIGGRMNVPQKLASVLVSQAILGTGVLVAVELLVALAIEARRYPSFDMPARLLYPRAIPVADVAIHPANGFQYYRPVDFDNGRCWDASLPCTDRAMTDVLLLQPEKGIGGGFRYQAGPGSK